MAAAKSVETGPSAKARASSARLSAVQALYESLQNGQPVRKVAGRYLQPQDGDDMLNVGAEGEALVPPDPNLLKSILFGLEERMVELDTMVQANIKKRSENNGVEPLLRAILLCGTYELLAHVDTDSPIIINDYLNVTHAFYGQNEASLVNAILDKISTVLRA